MDMCLSDASAAGRRRVFGVILPLNKKGFVSLGTSPKFPMIPIEGLLI